MGRETGILERLSAAEAAYASMSADYERVVADNRSMAEDAKSTAAALAAVTRRLDDTTARLEEANATIERLMGMIRLANARAYGASSEKNPPEYQGTLFDELELEADESAPEPEAARTPGRAHRRGGRRAVDLSGLETTVVEHTLEGEALRCPRCGEPMGDMRVEVTSQVRLVPAHFEVVEHRRHVYVCKACSRANAEDGGTPASIVRAPVPNQPIPGSFAHPSLIAYVLHGKFVNAMPLYRIERDMAAAGLAISRQDMSNWVLNVHRRWLSKVHARMRGHLLSYDYIHADETPVQVLREPGRRPQGKSYMWLFCAPACVAPNYIFEYRPTRSGQVARDFLEGWSGYLTTDGYRPYFRLGPQVTNTACLVHLRRKLDEVVKSAGSDALAQRACSIALEGRRLVDAIFKADSAFDGMDAAERKAARDQVLRPLMEGFGAWAGEQLPRALPKSRLDEALTYAVTYWPYVMHVLDDGRLELSNNIAERAIRPFVIGRSNWMFCDSQDGARASAALYSIVATARANGLNPRLYIEWLLTELPNAGELTDAVLDGFLPWAESVPEGCRMGKAAGKE